MNVRAPNLPYRETADSIASANHGYISGFGNGFETEALPGALPIGRNSPQKCPYGLYAEQLSGSPFTAPWVANERSWLYRIRPIVKHWGRFKKVDAGLWLTAPVADVEMPIAPLRWDPLPLPKKTLTFREGIRTITTAGDAGAMSGMAAHVYLITKSMQDEYFYNADAEMMFCSSAWQHQTLDGIWHHRRRALRDRCHPAWRQDPRGAWGRRQRSARLSV